MSAIASKKKLFTESNIVPSRQNDVTRAIKAAQQRGGFIEMTDLGMLAARIAQGRKL